MTDNDDELDRIVARLKANAIVPLNLPRIRQNQANGIDSGPDPLYWESLKRGEHLNGPFLAAVNDDAIIATDPGLDLEFLARLERGDHRDDFLAGAHLADHKPK